MQSKTWDQPPSWSTSPIDPVTQRWIRNPSDERAAANGCRFNESRGQHVIDFAAHYLKLYEGDFACQALIARDWQIEVTMRLFSWEKWSERLNRWVRRFTKASVWVPKKNKKALALDTEVPTPNGWTTVGALKIGDTVFDLHGCRCRITDKTEIFTGRPCYEVEFSNGQKIICDEGHLWTTRSLLQEVRIGGRVASSRTYPYRDRETKEIAETLERYDGAKVHSLPVGGAIETPYAKLPIEPYVFGAWLGDGDSDGARITCSNDDYQHWFDEFAAWGVELRAPHKKANSNACRAAIGKKWGPFRTSLRTMGVLLNKHIPPQYLRASFPQRLALLQGLMDTDGCINKDGKNLIFSTSSAAMRDGVAELLSTLGIKFRIRFIEISESWWIQFHCFRDILPVFRMARKLARMRLSTENEMAARSRSIQILAVRPVSSRPVQCVTVDSPSHQFLVGRRMVPTHNSPTLAWWGLYLFAADGEMGQKVFFCAKDGAQAREIAGKHAIEMVMSSPELGAECDINKSLMQITHRPTRSILKPLSSGDSTAQKAKEGINGSVLVDETHVVDRAFMNRISRAGISRSEPLQIEVSTAGDDPESYGREQYEYGKRVESGEFEDERFFFISYEAPQDLTDAQLSEDPVKVGKLANPAWGHTVHEEEFLDDYRRSTASISKLAEFKKYRCNVWQQAVNPWLRAHDWRACKRDFTEADLLGRECFGALDLALTRDMLAWCLIFPMPELGPETYRILPRFFLPEQAARHNNDKVPFLNWAKAGLITLTPGDTADYAFVKKTVVDDSEKFALQEYAYDPWNADLLTSQLEEEYGLRRVKFPQTISNFAEPCRDWERLVISGQLQHNGHAVLTWQAGHVTVKSDPNGNIRPVKPPMEDLRKIDGIVGGIMALARAMEMAGKMDPSITYR